jgi:hypothetical protein
VAVAIAALEPVGRTLVEPGDDVKIMDTIA